MSTIHRIRQVAKYGWQHAGQISDKEFGGAKRLRLFFDIIHCYRRYSLWSNQYIKEHFWTLNKQERDEIGMRYYNDNAKREAWVKDFYNNRRFLAKWSRYEIEGNARLREKRNEAYTKQYGMGKSCIVEHGVELSRQHHLPGKIEIGNYVRLCKDTFIDYSGGVKIGNYVSLCYGTSIETHGHDLKEWGKGKEISIPSSLEIGEGAFIGLKTTILSSCHYIGKYARIGAGAVVTKDIPDYAMAVGVPARVIKIIPHDEVNELCN